MFYEEKIIDGVLMYRTRPDGEWRQCSIEKAGDRIMKLNAQINSKKRTREEEIEAFERLMSDNYRNMEKIEKAGINYMHSRTNSALWIWLERAKLDSGS